MNIIISIISIILGVLVGWKLKGISIMIEEREREMDYYENSIKKNNAEVESE